MMPLLLPKLILLTCFFIEFVHSYLTDPNALSSAQIRSRITAASDAIFKRKQNALKLDQLLFCQNAPFLWHTQVMAHQ